MVTGLHWASFTRGRMWSSPGETRLSSYRWGIVRSQPPLTVSSLTGDVRAAVPPLRGWPPAAGLQVVASTAPAASTVKDCWTLVVPRGQCHRGAIPSSSPDTEARVAHVVSTDPPFSLRRICQYFVSVNVHLRVFYCEIYQSTCVTRLAHLSTRR
jgi:hypothetical protein